MANEPAEINREQIRYVGEKSAIRFFNPQDPEDLERMEKTLKDKAVAAFVEDIGNMTAGDIKNWLTRYKDEKRTKDWEVCYVVSGSIGVKPEEFGEIQGFVNLYPEENYRKFLPKKYKEAKQVVSISYGRYPEGKPGQISGAIRQACMEIDKLKGDMVIALLIEEENNAGIKTAEDACFDNYGAVIGTDEEGKDEKDVLFILNWNRLNTRLHTQAESYFP